MQRIPTPLYYLSTVAIVALAYLRSLAGRFISDDWPMIGENPYLGSASAIPRFFTESVWASSAFELTDGRLYRPLYLLWYFVIHALAGPDPYWFHAATLLAHVVNTLLVLRIFDAIFPQYPQWVRWVGALAFGLFPAHAQAVGWISGGTDVVAGMFFLGAFLAYLHYRESRNAGVLFASLALFTGSVFVKETTVVFPVLLLTFDLLTYGRVPPPHRWRHWVAAGLVGMFVVVRGAVVGGTGLAFSGVGLVRSLEQSLLTARYLLVPWPNPVHFSYPVGGVASWLDIALGAAATALFVALFVRRPDLRFWVLWGACTSAVTLLLGFHEVGVFALRFLYLPSVMMVAIGVAVTGALRSTQPGSAFVVATLVLGCFTFLTGRSLGDWRSEETLWSKVVAQDSARAVGYLGLGLHYERIESFETVLGSYRLGLERVAEEDDRSELLRALAQQLAKLERYEESLRAYTEWNELEQNAEALLGMGNSSWMLGRIADARQLYADALELQPEHAVILANAAALAAREGDVAEARRLYERILSSPDADAHPEAVRNARAFLSRSR